MTGRERNILISQDCQGYVSHHFLCFNTAAQQPGRFCYSLCQVNYGVWHPMGIARYNQSNSILDQFFREIHDLDAKTTGQAPGCDLTKTSRLNELSQEVRIVPDKGMPFRMGDKRDKSTSQELAQVPFCLAGKDSPGQFDKNIAGIIYGTCPATRQPTCKSRHEMDLGTWKYRNRKFRCSEIVIQLLDPICNDGCRVLIKTVR